MPERKVIVGSRVGLHARPAALFVQAASKVGVPVSIGKPGHPAADARSILSVLSLDARGGDEVVISAEGDGADAALDQLAAFLEKDHDA
jgi:phosphocarrier protein HPr